MANNYRVIDEAAWERATHCAVFRNCVEPAFCVTFEADITNFRRNVKEHTSAQEDSIQVRWKALSKQGWMTQKNQAGFRIKLGIKATPCDVRQADQPLVMWTITQTCAMLMTLHLMKGEIIFMEQKTLAAIVARRSNFELLRIVAMLMIVAHHLAVHGVQHVLELNVQYAAYFAGSFTNRMFTCFLLPGGAVGVALFFMIAGYFLCTAKRTSVRKVAFETVFYSVLTCLLFVLAFALKRLDLFELGGGIYFLK